jgi:hypothetical protein
LHTRHGPAALPFERANALDRRHGDLRERLGREKPLVEGDEDVLERQQARKDIVCELTVG